MGYIGPCKQFPTSCNVLEYRSRVSFVVYNILLSCLSILPEVALSHLVGAPFFAVS